MTHPEQKGAESAIALTETRILLSTEPSYRVVEKNRRFIIEETSFDTSGKPVVLEQGPIARQLGEYLKHIAIIREIYSGRSAVMVLCSYKKPDDPPQQFINDVTKRPGDPTQRGMWKKFLSHELKAKREIRKQRRKLRKRQEYLMGRGHSYPAEYFFREQRTESHPTVAGTTWVYEYHPNNPKHLTREEQIREAIQAVKRHTDAFPSDNPYNTHSMRILIENRELRRGNPLLHPGTQQDQNTTIIYDYFAPMVNGKPNDNDPVITVG
jgi:hypothetical protein